MLVEKIKNELMDIVGPENFTEAKIDMVSYAYDAMGSRGTPDCAAWVTTTEQVSKVMQLAHRKRIPVIPRAAGTGIAGMAVPSHGGPWSPGQKKRAVPLRWPALALDSSSGDSASVTSGGAAWAGCFASRPSFARLSAGPRAATTHACKGRCQARPCSTLRRPRPHWAGR